jgi:hypothetical protein
MQTKRPGPIYDRMMRGIAEIEFAALCAWLGIHLEGETEFLSSVFARETQEIDLLARVGPERLLHLEYMRSPEPDMAARIVTYRGHIMRRHLGEQITQVAIVLGEGVLAPHDDPVTGFRLGLRTLYLRDADPKELLARPGLAPMAMLPRGSPAERAERLSSALDLIAKEPQPRQNVLVEAAMTLAMITLDRSTIDRIRKEKSMTVADFCEFYAESDFAVAFREQGEAHVFLELLRDRFPDAPDLEQLAAKLAAVADTAAVVRAIGRAAGPEDLKALLQA